MRKNTNSQMEKNSHVSLFFVPTLILMLLSGFLVINSFGISDGGRLSSGDEKEITTPSQDPVAASKSVGAETTGVQNENSLSNALNAIDSQKSNVSPQEKNLLDKLKDVFKSLFNLISGMLPNNNQSTDAISQANANQDPSAVSESQKSGNDIDGSSLIPSEKTGGESVSKADPEAVTANASSDMPTLNDIPTSSDIPTSNDMSTSNGVTDEKSTFDANKTPDTSLTPNDSSDQDISQTPTAKKTSASEVAKTPEKAGADTLYPNLSPEQKIQKAKKIGPAESKKIVNDEVDDHWNDIKGIFAGTGIDTPDKAKAYFLGIATKESGGNRESDGKLVLRHYNETAGNIGEAGSWNKESAHAYGAFQTAETAFKGAGVDKNWTQESDPSLNMQWYPISKANFYDPGISAHMGIRKIMYWMKKNRKAGFTGKDLLISAAWSHNNGATPQKADIAPNTPWYNGSNGVGGYGREIDMASAYYLNGSKGENKDHLTDDKVTYTGEFTRDKVNKAPTGTNWKWMK